MSRRGRSLLLLVEAFVVSRVLFAIAGVHFIGADIGFDGGGASLQLLDPQFLRHDLFRSLWYLHSQPPLFNAFCGLLLHLPHGMQSGVATTVFLALGLLIVLSTFLLLTELSVPVGVATVVSLLVVADPAMVLFEHWLYYSYPTAALLTFGMYACTCLLRRPSPGWAVCASVTLACVVFLDSHFQWPWLLAVGAVIGIRLRRRWRMLVCATGVPLLLVAGLYAKDLFLFGTITTSSWTGMNMARVTTAQASPQEIDRLIANGTLRHISAVGPFRLPLFYVAHGAFPHTGIPALDERKESNGQENFNNLIYVSASNRMLRDDIAFLLAEPGQYAHNVTEGVELGMIPSDEYLYIAGSFNGYLGGNYRAISRYARWYDGIVMLQPSAARTQGFVQTEHLGMVKLLPDVSLTRIGITLAWIFGGIACIVTRKRRRKESAAHLLLWLTLLYSFAVSSLFDMGENMRFTFEMGTVPVVMAVACVSDLVRNWTIRHRSGPPASA